MSEFQIVESILTENPYYKQHKKLEVKGLMLHSVGCSQPKASVFVKNWNKASYTNACVHGFIDGETGTVYHTIPWDQRVPHCGGSANNTHIGVECCEPAKIKYTGGANFTYNQADLPAIQECIKRTYTSAVTLFAQLCKVYNLDPLKDGVIISHKEGHDRGVASGHADIDHLWSQSKIGYTMNGFRKDVAAALKELAPATPDPIPDASTDPEHVDQLYRVRKSPTDSKSQLGAFKSITNAISLAIANPGYNVYDGNFMCVYSSQTVPFRFQVKSGETPLVIHKEPDVNSETWGSKVGAGIFTIIEIQNGSKLSSGWGLLKAYASRKNGWVDLNEIKHIL